ncbi:MAG: erythromycin esterase family protein [Armatimonadota bacterium]
MTHEQELAGRISAIAQPLRTADDLDPLLELVGDARFVLLGEATHGTAEYYLWRARLSQRLIREKGFSFIAVEGDWPDCYEVNRYIKDYPEAGASARNVLHAFERWPTWMWANWEVAALCEWLRQYNRRYPANIGFYGLDVYSLWESMEAIMDYLERAVPEAVPLAREAYRCFEPFGESEQAYAWSTRMVPETCEDEVIALLGELRQRARPYGGDREAAFNAEQNAQVMVDAERYYRAMVRSDNESWNVRDYHMADTLDRLLQFHGPRAKAIVWAHNTHIGDARATNMAREGLVNIGQIARERHAGDGVALVGCSSYQGSVIAAESWGAPMARMTLPEARAGSWEDALHCAGANDKLLLLSGERENAVLMQSRGHRAVGVVYQPEYEAFGNYVPTVLPERYDAVLYIDHTEALHPLHLTPKTTHEPPETYPWGL